MRSFRAVLCLISLITWAGLRFEGKIAALLALFALGITAIFLRRLAQDTRRFTLGFIAGTILLILPMFGAGTVLCSALAVSAFVLGQVSRAELLWAWPYVLLMFIFTVAHCLSAVDLSGIVSIWNGMNGPGAAGLRGVIQWLEISPPTYFSVTLNFGRLLVLVVATSVFSSAASLRRGFGCGVISAVPVVMLVAVAQHYNLLGLDYFVNYTEYWRSLKRVPSTFSDPNAFGVSAALLVPVFIAAIAGTKHLANKSLLIGLLMCWIMVSSYAGSRSFFLGIFVLITLWIFSLGHKAFLAFAAIIASGLLLINCFNSGLSWLPAGLSRVVASLNIESAGEAWFSRMTFWQIALSLWTSNLLAGAGLGAFRENVTPFTQANQLEISTWVDNANSLYLGILCETGLIGLIALILSLRALRCRAQETWYRRGAVCLAIMLFFGPHTDFDEVSVLAAFLIGAACCIETNRIFRGSWSTAIMGIGFAALIFFKSWYAPVGYYLWEQEGGSFYRWSGKRVRDILLCNERGEASLTLQAATPDIGSDPLRVRFQTGIEGARETTISDFSKHTVTFRCASFGLDNIVRGGQELLHYKMDVSRTWMPRNYGMGLDSRILGVKVYENPAHKWCTSCVRS